MDSEPLRNELLTSQWSGISPGSINYTGGNVGIGTIVPQASLDVRSNVYVNDILSGLVTRVAFDGSVVDQLGAVSFTRGNNILPYTTGKVGLAGNFSGNSAAATPNQWYYSAPPVTQPPFTLSFWFNPQSTTWYGTVMSLSNGSNFTYFNLDYGTSFNANNSLGFFMDLNTQWAILGTTLTTGALTLGSWYHVCVTMTSAWVAVCYVNGVQVSTQTGTGNFPTAPTRFIIGGNGDGSVAGVPSRGANFYMDDLRWYNRALSASEVLQMYNTVANVQYTMNVNGITNFTNADTLTIPSVFCTVNMNVNGQITVNSLPMCAWVELLTPVYTEFSWTGSQTFAVSLNAAVPTTARAVLADIFVTASSNDHQNITLSRSAAEYTKNWVDPRGQQPSTVFGANPPSSNHTIRLTYYGEVDGFTSNYGIWYSSQYVPCAARQTYFGNYGNSGSNGWVYMVIRGYTL